LRIVSDNVFERSRLAMKKALAKWASVGLAQQGGARRVTGIEFVDSRSSALVQAADAIAYIINRYSGGDEEFGGMFRDIGRKAWRHGKWEELAAPGRRSGSTGAAAPRGDSVCRSPLGGARRGGGNMPVGRHPPPAPPRGGFLWPGRLRSLA